MSDKLFYEKDGKFVEVGAVSNIKINPINDNPSYNGIDLIAHKSLIESQIAGMLSVPYNIMGGDDL